MKLFFHRRRSSPSRQERSGRRAVRLFQMLLETRRILGRTTLAAAGVVAFVTTYALILPAITLDRETAAETDGISVSAPASEETVSSAEREAREASASQALEDLDSGAAPADRVAAVALSQEGREAGGPEGSSSGEEGTFAAWCIGRADVSTADFPVIAEDAARWAEALQTREETTGEALWTEEVPTAGCIAFLDLEEDGEADRAGVVTEVKTGLLGGPKAVEIITEDEDGQLASKTYSLNDDRLFGYGVLPEEDGLAAGTEQSAGPEDLPPEAEGTEAAEAAKGTETAEAAEEDASAPAAEDADEPEETTGNEAGEASEGTEGLEEEAATDGADGARSDAETAAEAEAREHADAAGQTAAEEDAGEDAGAAGQTAAETDAGEDAGHGAQTGAGSDGTAGTTEAPVQDTAGENPAPVEKAAAEEEAGETALNTFQSLVERLTVYEHSLAPVSVDGITVTAEFNGDALPEDAELRVTPVDEADYADTAAEAAGRENARVKALDIAFFHEGEEIEPKEAQFVRITLRADFLNRAAEADVVHVDDQGEVTLMRSDLKEDEITLRSDSFSVYAIVYTVDFLYETDGETFDYSMAGGTALSLRELIQVLGIVPDGPETADDFLSQVRKVSFSDPSLLYVTRTEEETTAGELIQDLGLTVTYPLGLTQEEILAVNARPFAPGDWVLLSLLPFTSQETLTVVLSDGTAIRVHVTDAQDAVINQDGTVQTITNPSGTTMDLFDYWITEQEINGRNAWPGLNQSWGGHEDADGLNGSGNNAGINAWTEDEEHGHALKFSPAWEGTVYNGSKEGYYGPWSSVNKNGRDGLNSYTGSGDPFRTVRGGVTEGIVQGLLSDGYPVLTDNSGIGANGESLGYLFDPGVDHSGKASYPSVDQLLYVDREGYYTYDSRDYWADFDQDDRTFTLTEQTSDNSEIRGFWPFGTQNFWVGMHLNTQFSIPEGGQVLNPSNQLKDMQFEFSGDDDTWLYVDGVLVGDGGGIHNRTEIDINFRTGTVTVTGKKDANHSGSYEETRYLDDIFRAAGRYDPDQWEPIPGDETHTRFKGGTYHTFDMFYLERGGGESNLYIHYNLVSTADFTAHKTFLDEKDSANLLKRDQFQFQLIGLDGRYEAVWNEAAQAYVMSGTPADANGRAIMPAGGSPDGDGTVASPAVVYDGARHRTVYTTGVTEDGNVNFGTALISEEEKARCDRGTPSVYRYIVREIVPDDAVNGAGVTWAEADEATRNAGGFHKGQVAYDSSPRYMTARVTSWQETGADGRSYTRYGLSKTYYTDDTFTETVDDAFINFENRYETAYGNVSFRKEDPEGNPLEGAVFGLYRDAGCRTPLVDPDDQTRTPITASSGADGTVTFSHVLAGTYYMKEITPPQGFVAGTAYIRSPSPTRTTTPDSPPLRIRTAGPG